MIFRFREDRSVFHHIDPLSKFIWVMCMSIIAVTVESAMFQLLLFAVTCGVGCFLANLSIRELWRGLRIPFIFGVPYFLLQLIFLPGEKILFSIGSLNITQEAVLFAAAVSIRLVTLMALSLIFVVSTDPRDVVLTLAQKCKVPYRIAFAVSLALRFLPLLEEEAKLVREAMKRRGAKRSKFVFMIFGSAVQRVHHIALGMEMKGFGAYKDRTYIKAINIRASGICLSIVSAVLMIASLLFI